MSFLELAKNRFTTKDYVPGHKLSPEEREEIISAGNLAPTANGLQQARIIFIEDDNMKQKIGDCFMSANTDKVLAACATVLVIGMTPKRFTDNDCALIIERKAKDPLNPTPQEIVDARMLGEIIDGDEPFFTGRKVADILACAAVADYMTLAATDLGYGSTIMTGVYFDKMADLLKSEGLLFENERFVEAICIGVTDEESSKNNFIKNNKVRINLKQFATIK